MKTFNKYLNILNLVEIVSIITVYALSNFFQFYLYSPYAIVTIFFIISGCNIISGIVNIVKKHKLIGILSIIAGVLPFFILLLLGVDGSTAIPIVVLILLITSTLSILNIIFNRKIEPEIKRKLPIIIIFAIIIGINILLFLIPFIQYSSDVGEFEKALSLMENEKNEKTYIIQANKNEYTFMDKNWNEISRKNFDKHKLDYFTKYMVGNNPINMAVSYVNGHSVLINSLGEVLMKTNTKDIRSFFDNLVGSKKYNVVRYSESDDQQFEYKKMTKYVESNRKFEENKNYTYVYFKNTDNSSKVIQVVFTNDSERDLLLVDAIEESGNSDSDLIEGFYKKKKEYYLIDFNNNTKIKLECNNLIYEALYNSDTVEENIILLSNGVIPFYDTSETGYFDMSGKKVSLSQPYLVYDCTDKYVIVNDRNSYKTFLISTETGNVEKEFNGNLIKYNDFYILHPYSYSGTYSLIDNNFNTILSSDSEPTIVDEKTVVISGLDDNKSHIYSINDNHIEEKYSLSSPYVKVYSSENKRIYSNNIYSNLDLAE